MRSIRDTCKTQSRETGTRLWLSLAVAALLLTLTAVGPAATAGNLDAVKLFDIPAQPLDKALLEFGLQAHMQINFEWNPPTSELHTIAVKGRYAGRAVLSQLLTGTGLQYSLHGDTVEVTWLQSDSRSGRGRNAEHLESAQRPRDPPPATSGPPKRSKPGKNGQPSVQLQEITVTGTHIRSAKESALPTQTFTREDIDRSGVGTVAAFLQTLPENSGQGMSETTDATVAGGGQSAEDATAGTGVNLRGLGSDATLVLIDGHRMAPADLYANFVDLSMIPLTDIERIDVVTDGASAIYGADAVGGVVNIITRHDYDGVETRVRFASDDKNDIHETQLGQTLGHEWGSGSGLLSYEFSDKTPLSAGDRSFTQDAPLPLTLLPEQVRQSVFATLNQAIGKRLSLYSDAYYSRRSTDGSETILGEFQDSVWAKIVSYGAIAGAKYAISDSTELDVSGDYSVGDADAQASAYPQPVPYSNQDAKSVLGTGDAILSGDLWSLPAGQILYAVGAQYRKESLSSRDLIAGTQFGPSRSVVAGFAELRVPVLASTNANGVSITRLDLSLADREERYSDFGSTNNTSIGLIWKPVESLQVRGTYGTSFVAPLLSDMNPVPFEVAGFNTSDFPGATPPGSGGVNELIVFGGNANLKAQTATTWTAGADWRPGDDRKLLVHANFYDIRFNNRINNLQSAGYNVLYALPVANVLGPQIVQQNPSATVVQQLLSSPNFINLGADVNNVGAVIDSRTLNLSRVNADGIDLRVAGLMKFRGLTVEPGVDASTAFHLDTRFTGTSPVAEMLNNIYDPTKTRVRAHVFFVRRPFLVAAFANYVNSYTNGLASPPTGIASWMTFDLSATYSCDACSSLLPGFSATIGVLNLLNRAPPFALNGNGFAVNYDGANANPLGRFISLDVSTRW